ncbi:MAG: fibronectin type III domain-containing protein [Cyclobacteriaceae bacterium]|nr:fibronectin type III domain-containing protein [Cyclobacteriaceae bacterium]
MSVNVKLIFLLLFISSPAFAQVSNNNIGNLLQLTLNSEPTVSHTQHNTVEWSCINKKLTEKCLIYHNDQWFSFIPVNNKTVYLNVGQQICKHKYGVQVLILKGNPCEKETYQLVHCESFTNQSDTYIELKNLQENTQYLINIDGFLGDLCSFSIAIADKPLGIPTGSQLKKVQNEITTSAQDSVLTLSWQLPLVLNDSISYFEIFRKKETEKKFTLVNTRSMLGNARGKQQQVYTVTNTLKEFGEYRYMVLGVSPDDNTRWHIGEINFKYRERIVQYWINIENTFTKKDDVTLTVIDAVRGRILKHNYCEACIQKNFLFNAKLWLETGTTRFKVLLTNNKTKKIKEMRYRFNADTGKIELE